MSVGAGRARASPGLREDLVLTCCEDQHVSLLPSKRFFLLEALSNVDETLHDGDDDDDEPGEPNVVVRGLRSDDKEVLT